MVLGIVCASNMLQQRTIVCVVGIGIATLAIETCACCARTHAESGAEVKPLKARTDIPLSVSIEVHK